MNKKPHLEKMKLYLIKSVIILLNTILVLLLFWSCIDQEPQEPIEEFSVRVTMPQDLGDTIHYSYQTVVLKSNRLTYSGTTDSLGKVIFKNIIPGIYDISTSQKLTDEISLTGDTLQFG